MCAFAVGSAMERTTASIRYRSLGAAVQVCVDVPAPRQMYGVVFEPELDRLATCNVESDVNLVFQPVKDPLLHTYSRH